MAAAVGSSSSRDVPRAALRYVLASPPVSGDELLARVGKGFPVEEYLGLRDQVSELKQNRLLDARTALPGGLKAWQLDEHGFTLIRPPPPPGSGLDSVSYTHLTLPTILLV